MTKIYNILIDLKEGDPFVIKRSQEALEIFARDVESFSFPEEIRESQTTLAFQPLDMTDTNQKSKSISSQEIEQFLSYCFKDIHIVQSKALAHFLWDPTDSVQEEQQSPQMSAIDFILQPFENQRKYIPRNQNFHVDVKLEKGDILVWKYLVGCGQQIDFYVIFCDSVFRSLKIRPKVDEIDSDSEATPSSIEISPNSPTSLEQKLSGLLDNFIKSGAHKNQATKVLQEQQFGSSNLSEITVVVSSLPMTTKNWQSSSILPSIIPTMSSTLSTPFTGSYEASRKGGLVRLFWDNSLSFAGKHLDYCIQRVSEQTMQVSSLHDESVNHTHSSLNRLP
jgi:hypothetical protein